MASTKTRTSIWSSETFTAGSAHADSSAVDLADGYGAALNVKITNGATAPTVALGLQIQVSNDNSAWFDFGGPLMGDTGNSEVVSWGGIQIPIEAKYLKIVNYQTNTGQNVTVDADISEVTAIS